MLTHIGINILEVAFTIFTGQVYRVTPLSRESNMTGTFIQIAEPGILYIMFHQRELTTQNNITDKNMASRLTDCQVPLIIITF